ncbi:hypothetical protein QBC34DRAFT_384410 [Podospora aff. communis PSN243]|uniref:Velvet domain-containing protein n=1 Tax=Podospora aff. communis PSN243 TaxID=3040156 RepID=A0AAV9GDD7_9PEZI|nr:hypothetical protein QBC34DRAFT_384410 [Podospora aff. communis PSN243]
MSDRTSHSSDGSASEQFSGRSSDRGELVPGGQEAHFIPGPPAVTTSSAPHVGSSGTPPGKLKAKWLIPIRTKEWQVGERFPPSMISVVVPKGCDKEATSGFTEGVSAVDPAGSNNSPVTAGRNARDYSPQYRTDMPRIAQEEVYFIHEKFAIQDVGTWEITVSIEYRLSLERQSERPLFGWYSDSFRVTIVDGRGGVGRLPVTDDEDKPYLAMLRAKGKFAKWTADSDRQGEVPPEDLLRNHVSSIDEPESASGSSSDSSDDSVPTCIHGNGKVHISPPTQVTVCSAIDPPITVSLPLDENLLQNSMQLLSAFIYVYDEGGSLIQDHAVLQADPSNPLSRAHFSGQQCSQADMRVRAGSAFDSRLYFFWPNFRINRTGSYKLQVKIFKVDFSTGDYDSAVVCEIGMFPIVVRSTPVGGRDFTDEEAAFLPLAEAAMQELSTGQVEAGDIWVKY